MASMTGSGTATDFPGQIKAEERAFLEALETELAAFFDRQENILLQISEESLPLLESIKRLSTGGKRMRALLCYWGWRGAGGQELSPEVVRAGAAVELFQTAALIHDDIIDRSDTRRGLPAVHRQFQSLHAENSWQTDGAIFGTSSAIIAGDLCLSWSEMMFSSIGHKASSAYEARGIFDLMRTEVMAGQYLDIVGEVIGGQDYSSALTRAQNVIRFKSAKYSCEHPLALGGALGANVKLAEESQLLDSYRAFALPLGEGFQLRDDVLGVFGKPEETGKPAGDDLKEGKRTVLVALTEKNASLADWQSLDRALGNQDLSLQDIEQLQDIIRNCGALSEVEAVIAETEQTVSAARLNLKVEPIVLQALDILTAKILHRVA